MYTVKCIIYTFSIIVISSGVHDVVVVAYYTKGNPCTPHLLPLFNHIPPPARGGSMRTVSSSRRSGNVVLMCRYQINPKVVVVDIHLMHTPLLQLILPSGPCGGPKFQIKIHEWWRRSGQK